MKIHEYQAKAILKKYGVTVPRGSMATSRDEAESVAKELLDSGSTGVVVKAQIHARGRGKGGGVKIAKSVNEAGDLAGKMLGMKLIYMDAGSGAKYSITESMIEKVSQVIEAPLIIGGGITTPEKAYLNCKAGADVIVVGNAIEKDPALIKEISDAIHGVSVPV